ncbi:MAG: hypothetical protein HUK20_08315, partial [Fibrobacter sp.]|nr:hypothetical protein [Fibrobacter sp.]
RLWLDHKGFRFPTECTNLAANYQYHGRTIEKCRNLLWFFDKSKILVPNNLYFVSKQSFSNVAGEWRTRKTGDVLWPIDEKIKARKLEQWLHEKNIPNWMFDFMPLYADGSRILFVEGITHTKNKV